MWYYKWMVVAGSREAVTQLTNNNQKPARDTHIQLHCYNSIPLVHGISLLRPFGGASSFWLASFRYLFLWLTLNRGLVFLSGIWLWWHSPTNVRICVCRLQSHYQPHRHPFNYPLGVYSYQLPICWWLAAQDPFVEPWTTHHTLCRSATVFQFFLCHALWLTSFTGECIDQQNQRSRVQWKLQSNRQVWQWQKGIRFRPPAMSVKEVLVEGISIETGRKTGSTTIRRTQ